VILAYIEDITIGVLNGGLDLESTNPEGTAIICFVISSLTAAILPQLTRVLIGKRDFGWFVISTLITMTEGIGNIFHNQINGPTLVSMESRKEPPCYNE